MSLAARQKRWRQRQKNGVRVYPVEIDQAVIEGLLTKRFLKPEHAQNRNAVAAALVKLAKTETNP